jgi:hypothetical protein
MQVIGYVQSGWSSTILQNSFRYKFDGSDGENQHYYISNFLSESVPEALVDIKQTPS